jgi:SAM-dependent methyltransferase
MKKINNCSICNKKFLKIIDLGLHPCADTFLDTESKANLLPRFPLQVGFCSCFHLTAINKVSGYERYQKFKYSYTADNSPVSRNHFKSIAKKIAKKTKLNKNSFVVEAGSNDGTFLDAIKKFSNAKVLGIDPSKNVSQLAKKKGIDTINDFFSLKVSRFITNKYSKADLFFGANVFNHVDDLINFLKATKEIIKEDGLIVIEVPDLESLINNVCIQTIYH